MTSKKEQIRATLSLLAVHLGREVEDGAQTRGLVLTEAGVSSLALASIVIDLEDRLDREFDFEAFAGMETIGDLLRAIGLDGETG